MRMNSQTIRVYRIIVGALALFIPATVFAMDPSNKEIAAMEEHWNKVTNEANETKRKALIEEHQAMMSSYSSIKIPSHDGPMGDMHSHDREMHIKNTVNMHTHMMKMMQ